MSSFLFGVSVPRSSVTVLLLSFKWPVFRTHPKVNEVDGQKFPFSRCLLLSWCHLSVTVVPPGCSVPVSALLSLGIKEAQQQDYD